MLKNRIPNQLLHKFNIGVIKSNINKFINQKNLLPTLNYETIFRLNGCYGKTSHTCKFLIEHF